MLAGWLVAHSGFRRTDEVYASDEEHGRLLGGNEDDNPRSPVRSSPILPPASPGRTVLQIIADQIAGTVEEEEEEEFYCPVCLEYHELSDGVQFRNCGHRFGRDCIGMHFHYQIQIGKVKNMNCFHVSEEGDVCGAVLECDEILNLVSPEDRLKYNKFLLHRRDDRHRDCPTCDHTQLGDPAVPAMVCEECGGQYCFAHGAQHPGVSCEEFQKSNRKYRQEERRNRRLIKELTKACPGCSVPIVKRSGCNHMKCSICQCSWCWLCGDEIDDVPMPEHYAAWNIRGCPGRQMEGAATTQQTETFQLTGFQRSGWRKKLFLFLISFVYLWFYLFVAPLAAVVSSGFFFLCFGCIVAEVNPIKSSRKWQHAFEFFFTAWSSVICLISSCMCCCPLGSILLLFKAFDLNPQNSVADEDNRWRQLEDESGISSSGESRSTDIDGDEAEYDLLSPLLSPGPSPGDLLTSP